MKQRECPDCGELFRATKKNFETCQKCADFTTIERAIKAMRRIAKAKKKGAFVAPTDKTLLKLRTVTTTAIAS